MAGYEHETATAPAANRANLKRLTGSNNKVISIRLIRELISTLWLPSGTSPDKAEPIIKAALAALEGIKPQDEIEGMLAVQMVATHKAAIECLRRAMLDDQTFEGREANLKHAAKLMTLYLQQIDGLNKHRGKGTQKVTVEYVHVEAGGQAVVGAVQAGAAVPEPDDRRRKQPLALTDGSGTAMPILGDPLATHKASKVRRT